MTLWVASLVLISDRLTKYIVIKRLLHGQSIIVFPNIFHITLVLNKGTAFGLFKDQNVFLISLSVLAISFIIIHIWLRKAKDALLYLGLGLILGGAVGNLIDRIIYGYVIDFLDFRIWPVFNIADSSITIGAIILTCRILLTKSKINPKF